MYKKVKAIALLSGGLDSTLAVKLILDQGIAVTAIKFMTYFGCDAGDSGSCGHDSSELAKQLGFELKLCHLGQEYVKMVRNPKYGWGKNMNPCIDCRITMLSAAKEYMQTGGGDFLITGEVLGQRPMSQHNRGFDTIDKEAGLEGLVLRPLSAKLLKPTIPEENSLVDRERLLDISGRSRRRQYELAKKWDITDFGQPAGGCLLTDPEYSEKLWDLFAHEKNPTASDILLLQVGRHFRPKPDCKIVVGRNERENMTIEGHAQSGDAVLYLKDFNGPTVLVRGNFGEKELKLAAGLTVRYGDSDKNSGATIEVKIKSDGTDNVSMISEKATEESDFVPLRVNK